MRAGADIGRKPGHHHLHGLARALETHLLGTGFALFNATMYSALYHTSAINVSIEQAAIPMFIFLANFLLFRTGVTWIQLGGFALTIIGVMITAGNGDFARLAALEVNYGDALMLLDLDTDPPTRVPFEATPNDDGLALVVWPHRTDRALGLVVGLGCLAYAGFFLTFGVLIFNRRDFI